MRSFLTVFTLLPALVAAHGRIRFPIPLGKVPRDYNENIPFNNPLAADGTEFPCKQLHKNFASIPTPPGNTFTAGQMAHFEIQPNDGPTPEAEGNLAAHSGGSCQASLSFDQGKTWKVLHSFIGGCPRGATMDSNVASPDQKFPFMVPAETKSGPVLFAWTWILVTGNSEEYYMNCAKVEIVGSGESELEDLADMYVGEMTIPGVTGAGTCQRDPGFTLDYPEPGKFFTRAAKADGKGFKPPSPGVCKVTKDTPPWPVAEPGAGAGAGTGNGGAIPSAPAPSVQPTPMDPVPSAPAPPVQPTPMDPVPTAPAPPAQPTPMNPVPPAPSAPAVPSAPVEPAAPAGGGADQPALSTSLLPPSENPMPSAPSAPAAPSPPGLSPLPLPVVPTPSGPNNPGMPSAPAAPAPSAPAESSPSAPARAMPSAPSGSASSAPAESTHCDSTDIAMPARGPDEYVSKDTPGDFETPRPSASASGAVGDMAGEGDTESCDKPVTMTVGKKTYTCSCA